MTTGINVADGIQIGASGTATQNFVLRVPAAPDGTIKLARGNDGATTQDILLVDVNGKVLLKATAAAAASINLPHGTLPSAPADGDIWTTTAGLFVRINGVTKTVTLT